MLSKAATNILKIDLTDYAIPKIKEIIESVAMDVSNEDNLSDFDPFFRDEVANQVIHMLVNFLTQSYVDTDSGLSPLVSLHQMKPKYVRSWFGVAKKKK